MARQGSAGSKNGPMPEATSHGQLSAAPPSNAAVARTSHSVRLRISNPPEIRRRTSRRSNADVDQVMVGLPIQIHTLAPALGGKPHLLVREADGGGYKLTIS